MKGILGAALFAAVGLAYTTPASAFFKQDGQDRYEQERIREAEFKRASRLGGYSDPISAFMDLISGEVKEKDIQKGISNRYEAEDELYRIPKRDE